jgi:hypothetical protein
MKFIVCTRLYSDKIGTFDAEAASNDRSLVEKRGILSELVMGPSLMNQTDRNFVHYTIVNDKASDAISRVYKCHLASCGVETTLVRKSEWPELLKSQAKECLGPMFVARIDDDDAIHKNAVELAKRHFRKGMVTVYGYTTGIRTRIGDGFYRMEKVSYGKSGHHSIFQTFMFDQGHETINPYDFDHSNVVGGMVSRGISRQAAESSIVNGDKNVEWPAFLYLRHGYSVSTSNKAWYDDDSRFEKTKVSPEFLVDRFGLSTKTQKKILTGTLFQ